MTFLFYILLISIFVLIYILFKSKNNNIFVTILCSLLILQIVIAPKLCIDFALLGAKLFFYKVFPSLFPFLVISSVMMSYNGVYVYSKILGILLCKPLRLPKECSFVLVISMLCGYPLGAKYACDLYENGTIDIETLKRLTSIASNPSPLFIIGSVGTAMLNNQYIGYIVLLSSYLSCFLVGVFLPAKKNTATTIHNRTLNNSTKNIGYTLKESIENSIKTCFSIGGFVIIFSVITNIIKSNTLFDIAIKYISYFLNIPVTMINGLLLGLIEMTNGCYFISLSTVSIYYKLALISFIVAFSGISIITQVYSFTYKYKISIKKYVLIKLIQGLFCSILSIILYRISILKISLHTFSLFPSTTSHIFLICLLLLIAPTAFYRIKKLFYTS